MNFVYAWIIGAVLHSTVAQAQGAIRIDSTGNVDRRVAVAIPRAAAEPEMAGFAGEFAEVIAYDLTFSGLFRTLVDAEYPQTFRGLTRNAADIDFEAWRNSKAEYLVYAFLYKEGEMIVAESRLFDAYTGRQAVGLRLRGHEKFPRAVAHRFSEEIIRAVDGTPGIGTSEICFSAGRTGNKEIYMADYDGANVVQVTHHNSISILPRLSPNGTKIAYLSYKDRYPYLYIYDRNTGQTSILSKRVGLNASPAWSPDGSQVAVVLSKDANTEIYLLTPSGDIIRRLTNNKASDTSPTFSPAGDRIAFVSDRAGYAQIYAMDMNGGNVSRLSYQGGSSYDPVWSPDGAHIAYVVERGDHGREIYVMDATGSNPRQLTNSYGSNESPTWSGDSRHVMFCSTRDGGEPHLYTVTVETGEERRVPRIAMQSQGPSWGPRRK